MLLHFSYADATTGSLEIVSDIFIYQVVIDILAFPPLFKDLLLNPNQDIVHER
jgi:hypothetical protein